MFNETDRKLLALHASRAHSAHQFACVRYVNENYRKEIIFELRHTHTDTAEQRRRRRWRRLRHLLRLSRRLRPN